MNKWFDILPHESCRLACDLAGRAVAEREAGKIIYPVQENIFRALALTPPDKLVCCVLGQDPYHGSNQANGLAFSVNPGVKLPPSLKNIFKELQEDIGCEAPFSGDLSHWAEQGVLLLNTCLTVEEGKANSHSNWGWQKFTSSILQATRTFPQPICFILWGTHAQSAALFADVEDTPYPRLIIQNPHPSPLSAYRGFFGSHPFSKTNDFLQKQGYEPIHWNLTRKE